MVELDSTLAPLASLVNECYETLFPDYPRFPQFSFARAMATVWREKVHGKIVETLANAFAELLGRERAKLLAAGKLLNDLEEYDSCTTSDSCSIRHRKGICGQSESPKGVTAPFSVSDVFPSDELRVPLLLSRYAQSVADLSINELAVHFLGSTKISFDSDEPYRVFHDTVVASTKYLGIS